MCCADTPHLLGLRRGVTSHYRYGGWDHPPRGGRSHRRPASTRHPALAELRTRLLGSEYAGVDVKPSSRSSLGTPGSDGPGPGPQRCPVLHHHLAGSTQRRECEVRRHGGRTSDGTNRTGHGDDPVACLGRSCTGAGGCGHPGPGSQCVGGTVRRPTPGGPSRFRGRRRTRGIFPAAGGLRGTAGRAEEEQLSAASRTTPPPLTRRATAGHHAENLLTTTSSAAFSHAHAERLRTQHPGAGHVGIAQHVCNPQPQ